MTGYRLTLAAVAALAAAGAARRRGSAKRSPETLPPLLQAEQDYLQRHRCVLAVYKQKTDASLPPHERLDQAFALCTYSLQDLGFLRGNEPTRDGVLAGRRKARDPGALKKQREYQRLKELARQSRRKARRGSPKRSALEANLQRRGSANKKPSQKSLKASLQKIRDAMDPVFSCETVWGDCHADRPSAGHCFMAALAVQDMLGGTIQFGEVETPGGSTPHYWNKIGAWEMDITGDQFREPEVQIKRGELRPSLASFDRERYEWLTQDFNAEPMKIYDKFRTRLSRELEKADLCEYMAHLQQMEEP
jgi:hypothetical protein